MRNFIKQGVKLALLSIFLLTPQHLLASDLAGASTAVEAEDSGAGVGGANSATGGAGVDVEDVAVSTVSSPYSNSMDIPPAVNAWLTVNRGILGESLGDKALSCTTQMDDAPFLEAWSVLQATLATSDKEALRDAIDNEFVRMFLGLDHASPAYATEIFFLHNQPLPCTSV